MSDSEKKEMERPDAPEESSGEEATDAENESSEMTGEMSKEAESNAASGSVPVKASKRKTGGFNRIPLVIAGFIFLAAIIFFGAWKCFFDTTLEGDWSVEMSSADGSQHLEYAFSFDDDNVFRMHNGGTTYIGRYYLDTYDDGTGEEKPIFSIYITNLGRQFISGDFAYQFEGNAFSGRILKLTDLSGIFFPPDSKDADEETVKMKKSVTDSVVMNDTTFYIWNFSPAVVTDHIDHFDDFKVNKEILGSWLCEDKDEGFSYTLTFEDDGTFEQRSYEILLRGSYHFEGKKCTLKFYSITDTEGEVSAEPVIKDNKMTFDDREYVRTSGRDDYKREAN